MKATSCGRHRKQPHPTLRTNGRANKQWGAGADSDACSSKADPGGLWSDAWDQGGRITNPVDITIIPTKEGDGFAAFDALGRVQF